MYNRNFNDQQHRRDRSGSSLRMKKSHSPNRSPSEGILRNKSSPGASPHHTPLRSKSRSRSPVANSSTRRLDAYESDQKMDLALRDKSGHSSLAKQTNQSLRHQYYRQINLCKKTNLNFYETSILVGYLLDLINLSRKLEGLKIRLVHNSDEFNFIDAFHILQPKTNKSGGI